MCGKRKRISEKYAGTEERATIATMETIMRKVCFVRERDAIL
jgi:hypothetical protein